MKYNICTAQVIKPVFDAVTAPTTDPAFCALVMQHAMQIRGIASTLMRCPKAALDVIDAGLHRKTEYVGGACNIWGVARDELRRFRFLVEPASSSATAVQPMAMPQPTPMLLSHPLLPRPLMPHPPQPIVFWGFPMISPLPDKPQQMCTS